MSLKKQYLKTKPVCKVTFKLTAEEAKNASCVKLIGDFNQWDESVKPMKKLKNGSFTQTVNLPAGAAYEFRYLLDENTWENDWEADAYNPSVVSLEDNSVVKV
jgi:1,4-alpha-glucan branching enzyme